MLLNAGIVASSNVGGGDLSFPGLIHYYKLTQTTGAYVDSHGAVDLTIVGSGGLTRTSSGAVFSDLGANYLERNALNIQDTPIYIATWIRPDDIDDFGIPFSEAISGSFTDLWRVIISLAGGTPNPDKFSLQLAKSGTFSPLLHTQSLVQGDEYLLELYHDTTGNQWGLSMTPASAGTVSAFETISFAGGINSIPTAKFTIGNIVSGASSQQFEGRIREFAIASTLPSDLTSSSTFRNDLFNAGVPLTYEDLNP